MSTWWLHTPTYTYIGTPNYILSYKFTLTSVPLQFFLARIKFIFQCFDFIMDKVADTTKLAHSLVSRHLANLLGERVFRSVWRHSDAVRLKYRRISLKYRVILLKCRGILLKYRRILLKYWGILLKYWGILLKYRTMVMKYRKILLKSRGILLQYWGILLKYWGILLTYRGILLKYWTMVMKYREILPNIEEFHLNTEESRWNT